MKVVVVNKEDYQNILYSLQGLATDNKTIKEADLVIDKDTGKILKSRFF